MHSIHANSRIFDTYESRVEEMMLMMTRDEATHKTQRPLMQPQKSAALITARFAKQRAKKQQDKQTRHASMIVTIVTIITLPPSTFRQSPANTAPCFRLLYGRFRKKI